MRKGIVGMRVLLFPMVCCSSVGMRVLLFPVVFVVIIFWVRWYRYLDRVSNLNGRVEGGGEGDHACGDGPSLRDSKGHVP